MSLARCDEEFSIGELTAALLQFASQSRLVERSAIDDPVRSPSVLDVEVDVDHEASHLAAFRTFQ